MRRSIVVLLLVTVAVMLLMAGPAFAKTGTKAGGYWPLSSNFEGTGEPVFFFEIHGGPLYEYASPEISPHDGLASSTGKCKVCHAVHGAGMTTATGALVTEKLLRSTAADACVFCHLTGGTFAFDPYNTPVTLTDAYGALGQQTGHVTTSVENYNSNDSTVFGNAAYPRSSHSKTHGHDNPQTAQGGVKSYRGCVSCHAVHDANTIAGGTYLLKNDPAKMTTSQGAGWGKDGLGYGSKYAPVTTQVAFCEDCHDGTKLVGPMDATQPATQITVITSQSDFNKYFPSCGANGVTGAACHNSAQQDATGLGETIAQFGAFKTPMHNGRSHIMTTNRDAFVADPASPGGKYLIASNVSTTPDGDGYAAATNGCISCHAVDAYDPSLGFAQDATFPHFSPGNELIPTFNLIGAPDSVCRDCHEGVGTKF